MLKGSNTMMQLTTFKKNMASISFGIAKKILQSFDTDSLHGSKLGNEGSKRITFQRVLPFLFLHAGCALAIVCGWSPLAIGVAIALYWVRMFAITAFYHRYFSHRTFKTSRWMQFAFAFLGLMAVQKGPLWWAAHHRNHHAFSDQEKDLHSPYHGGFWWSHIGWIMTDKNMITDYSRVPDFSAFPELRILNRFDWLGAAVLILSLYFVGNAISITLPSLKTNGFQMVVWGFFISTTVLFHGTATINSLSHQFGSRRYDTNDHSRNNPWLAIITLGEGWHNNHHQYPGSTRQGFYWWELDITYLILCLLAKLGWIWQIQPVPKQAYAPTTQLSPASILAYQSSALVTEQ